MIPQRIFLFAAVLFALTLALGLTTRSARADTIFVVNVTVDHDDGICDASDCTLREAMHAAQPSGTVQFDPNFAAYPEIHIDSSLGSLVLDPNSSVIVDGELTQNGTILGDLTLFTNGGTVFRVQQGSQLDVRNLTITGANTSAIYNTAGTVKVNNSHFSGNQSLYGHAGAIYNYQGTVTASNSSFDNNSAHYNGGAISNQFGTTTVTNTTFYANSANLGGSLDNWNGTLTLTNSTILNSTAATTGGAINNSSSTLIVNHSGISGNSANDGGAIANFGTFGGTLSVTDSTFSNNTAKDGGAILNTGNWPSSYAQVTIVGSLFTLNNATGGGSWAPEGGAGLNNYRGAVTVANSVFLNNNHDAAGGGNIGGIVSDSGVTLVLNSTIASNSGGGLFSGYFGNLILKNSIAAGNAGADCVGPVGDGGYNLSGDATCQFSAYYHSLVGVDPLFESNDSLNLQPNSPAIDAADDSVCAAAPVNNFDLLGAARPRGPHCDMGAYEMPRASLTVIKHVINDDGGTKQASDFTMNVSATNPSSFPGAESPGTLLGIAPGSYSVTESGQDGYTSSTSNCSGSLQNNAAATCTITNDDTQPTPTPTNTPTNTPVPTDTPTPTATATSTDTPTPTLTPTVTPTSPASSYTFTGFFPPVDNLPALNVAKAGSAIPVKFGLGGDYGLNIFAEGYPASQEIVCDSSAPKDPIEETVSASSGLTYDATTNTYSYTWKTKKTWVGSCRQLILQFTDGTVEKANFRLK